MKHLNGPWIGALFNATAAIPAFFRIEDNGRAFFFRIRHQNIGGAYIHAGIASVTNIMIKLYRLIWGGRIRHHVDFVAHLDTPFLESCGPLTPA